MQTIPNYPFGMLMPARTFVTVGQDHRYGFNGQELDNELMGTGNAIAFKYRVHDPRVGRFFSVDPIDYEFPWNSPYSFAENKVIMNIELEGAETFNATKYMTSNGYVLVLDLANPTGPVQFNQMQSSGGRVRPLGTVRPSINNNAAREEVLLRGTAGGNSTFWRPINGANGLQNNHNASSIEYDSYRPILWKSSNDGTITSDPITTSSTVRARTYGIETGDPESTIDANLNMAASEIRAISSSATAPVTPIGIATGTIATIPHPDAPGQTISFTQTSVTGVASTLSVSQITMDITVKSEYRESLQDEIDTFIELNPDIVVNVSIDDSMDEDVMIRTSYKQDITSTTTTTTATVATDSSTGNTIPQGN